MGTLHIATRTSVPPATAPGQLPSKGQVDAIAGGKVVLGSSWQSMDEIWPAVDVTNGPLTADSGIVAGLPSTAGLKFIPANQLGAFNYQAMYMIAASAARNAATVGGTRGMYNAPTPRIFGFGTLGSELVGGNMDIGFVADSVKVIPVWSIFNAYDSVTYHDMHMCASHRGGRMKQLNKLPVTSNGGGGVFHRVLQFNEAWQQEYRLFLPGRATFLGVYVDTLASIRASANKQLFLHNGDSWNEPLDATFKSERANQGYRLGSYMCLGISERLSIISGQRWATIAQGGTGPFNDGQGNPGSLSATGTGSTVCWSDSRTNDFVSKFAPRNSIVVDVGGWNAGNLGGTSYKDTFKARLVAGYTKVLALKPDLKFINVGIQPVDISAGDARDLSMQAQAEIPAAFPNNCLGHISLKEMWTDTSKAGPRSVNCIPENMFGVDLYIHHTVGGKDNYAGWVLPRIAQMTCDANYVNAMLGVTVTS